MKQIAQILILIGAVGSVIALILVVVSGGKTDPHQKLIEELEAAEAATERIVHEIEDEVRHHVHPHPHIPDAA